MSVTCFVCQTESQDGVAICPTCGTPLNPNHNPLALSPGSLLKKELSPTGGYRYRYKIEELLGQGGFGITYKAFDNNLNCSVVLKELFIDGKTLRQGGTVVPTPTYGSNNFSQDKTRFLEEARILVRFRHPGIVRVFDAFEENGTAYYAMELVAGKTLSKKIEEEGRLSSPEVVELAKDIGKALKEVHAAKLLHRDIKPDNIFWTDDRRAVLIDFGTARAFVADKTQNVTAVVTRGYAPLEQYSSQGTFGPYTDIYALAATLLHALTGQPPPDAYDRVSAGAALPQFPADTPAGLRSALLRSLEIQAAKRPQNVDDFLQLLEDQGKTDKPEVKPEVRKKPSWVLGLLFLLIACALFYRFYKNTPSLPPQKEVAHQDQADLQKPMPPQKETKPKAIPQPTKSTRFKPQKQPAPPPTPKISPFELQAQIKTALRNAGLGNVDVAVSPGFVVTLRGAMESRSEKSLALRIARTFAGVKEVRDQIYIVAIE